MNDANSPSTNNNSQRRSAAVIPGPGEPQKTTHDPSSGPSKPQLHDDRKQGEYETRYPLRAWISISIEAVYLIAILIGLLMHFIFSMTPMASDTTSNYGWFMVNVAGAPKSLRFQYFIIATAGALGGTLFSTKWLIHTVAKGYWNEDRRLWRFFVPLTAAVTSVIFAAIVQSGIISVFNENTFADLEVSFAFGGRLSL